MKIKIRGIYSTALTKFLKEKGFEIVSPSEIINQRLSIENNDAANTLIYDKEDLNGITISGTHSSEVVNCIKERFYDIVIREIENGAIYCGFIKKINPSLKTILVDLGGEEGVLPLQNYWGFLREGEKVLVQVKGVIRGKKILTTKLRIFGENAIIIKDGFPKVSKHIKSKEEREKLEKLSQEVKKDGWGVLWKALAEGKKEEILREELISLVNKEKEIKEKFNKMKEPGLIMEGNKVYYVEFGALTKKELDNIRRQVLNTIPGHHFLKSGDYSILVDFAEALDIEHDILINKLNKVLKKNGPQVGRYYEIIHKKANGREIVFKGIITEVNGEEIRVKRTLKSGGRLDGIGGKINPGDFAITIFKPNEWHIVHKYFDKNGYPKGTYISINTPIEVYPNFARYIDLEVDVIERGGKKEVIDLEKLERIKKAGMIKEELAQRAIEIANKIKEELK